MVTFLLLAALQDPDVDRIQKKFKEARPSEKDLAIFQLDWEPDFEKARERAAKEKRPLIFIWNNNISGPDSLYTGHC